jgi:hypothetical protein
MTATSASPFYTSPQPKLLADRAMKARTSSRCALDNCLIQAGMPIGRLPDGRWAAVRCIVRAAQDVPGNQAGAAQEGTT